jgi:hypothetical protein
LTTICAAVLGVYVIGYLLVLEKPAWFLEQCTTGQSCYQQIPINRIKFYKTGFNSSVIVESSGLITSRQHPGTIWTHNDSGSFPFIYAIDQFGNLQGGSYIVDSLPLDWEDIASDNQGNLYILDYGRIRTEQIVYVIAEPDPLGFTLSVTNNKIVFTVPDLPKNAKGQPNIKAEVLLWNDNKLYLLTKDKKRRQTTLYRFPDIHSAATVTLERIATFDLSQETFEYGGRVTGADISQDGKFLVVLSYWALYFFQLSTDDDKFFASPMGSILTKGRIGQSEGVSWLGNDVLVSNEEDFLFLLKEPLIKLSFRPTGEILNAR